MLLKFLLVELLIKRHNFTENISYSHGQGDLQLLGSGMHNTKLYSGGTSVFVEDNIFEIVIPMGSVAKLQVGPEETSKEIEETGKEICNKIIDILEMRPEIAVKEVAQIMEMSVSGVRYHIEKMKKKWNN